MRKSLLILFLFLGYLSSAQKATYIEHLGNDSAKKLMETLHGELEGGHLPARAYLPFLNEIIKLDSNYYDAFLFKFDIHAKLGEYDSALSVAQKLNMLEPQIADNYVRIGVLYTIKKNHRLSKSYFKRAEKLYDETLDTLKFGWKHDLFLFKKGLNLLYVGEYKKSNEIFRSIYSDKWNLQKRLDTYMNKSSREALDLTIKNYYYWH